MVSSVVLDMRDKIVVSIKSAANLNGCIFGQVDDYLKSFEEQIERMKAQFAKNKELLLLQASEDSTS